LTKDVKLVGAADQGEKFVLRDTVFGKVPVFTGDVSDLMHHYTPEGALEALRNPKGVYKSRFARPEGISGCRANFERNSRLGKTFKI